MDTFFGLSEEDSFTYFSFAHFAPLILMGVAIFLIIKYRNKLAAWKHESALRHGFAFAMVIGQMSYFWRLIYIGGSAADHLPITICGWASLFCAACLLTKRKTFFEIAYFWVFGASLFALLMPAVITKTGPEYYRYYQYWFEHTAIFISIIYMMFVHKMRPTWFSMLKSAAAMVVLTAVALCVNASIPGANYLFMANVKEAGASILDILPHAIYLKVIIMAAVYAVLGIVAYLPWLIKDIKHKKQVAAAAVNKT